jgi:serine/threonine protein phosphatase PrpC
VRSWLIVNIGDSRTYLSNSDGLRQLSVDHTVVQELIDAGAISPAEASSHPSRNLLTRALLGEASTRPTVAAADACWRPGPGLLGRTDERSR